jgi:mannose-1-phosphate guanylyltransferase/phosphomannomutase
MAFGKALELVAATGRPLSETIDALPRPHVAQREVRTPWDRKGAVMRRVAASVAGSRAEGFELVLVDGVKAQAPDRWALVVPYPDEPLCGVWAEAGDAEEAEALADRFAGLVEEVVATPDE